MTHPEDLLAGYVDGTLTERERAVVDGHLATCEACNEELALASEARTLLAGLPEVDVPAGVTRPVMDEIALEVARDRAAGRARPAPWRARLTWAAGFAAAAALVVVFALNVVPGGGGGTAGAPVREAASPALSIGGAGPSKEPTLVPLMVQTGVNYDAAKVEELAQDIAKEAMRGAAVPQPSFAVTDSTSALECVERGSAVSPDDPTLRPVEVVEAKWRGRPAYLGVFLQSPGPGQPPDKVIVWIVARSDCSLLSYAFQRA